jgi:hypothetical protein
METVNLSTDPRVRIDCERCGRRISFFDVMDDPGSFSVWEVERQPLRSRYVRPTGRHRLGYVDGRDGDTAYSFECGCGHRRTISRDALKAKLVRASEPLISL